MRVIPSIIMFVVLVSVFIGGIYLGDAIPESEREPPEILFNFDVKGNLTYDQFLFYWNAITEEDPPQTLRYFDRKKQITLFTISDRSDIFMWKARCLVKGSTIDDEITVSLSLGRRDVVKFAVVYNMFDGNVQTRVYPPKRMYVDINRDIRFYVFGFGNPSSSLSLSVTVVQNGDTPQLIIIDSYPEPQALP